MVTKEQVIAMLSTVMDPDLNQDLVSLGMIENLNVDGGDVSVDVILTTPACPLRQKIETDVKNAISSIPRVQSVKVNMKSRVRKSMPAINESNHFGHVIAVGSGKGGVGKSTIAVVLATALSDSGARVGLLDADIYGPNIPRMLGIDSLPETPEGQKIKPAEVNCMKVLSIGFFVADSQPLMWRGPMLHSAIQQFLTDFEWGELDYLVVDLPPGTGDVQLSLSQVLQVSGAVVVTTPQQVAVDDAARAVSMFQTMKIPVLGIVENMAYLTLPDGQRLQIFGEAGGEHLAFRAGIPLLGRIPLDPEIGLAGDTGTPYLASTQNNSTAGAFREMAGRVAAELSILEQQKKNAG